PAEDLPEGIGHHDIVTAGVARAEAGNAEGTAGGTTNRCAVFAPLVAQAGCSAHIHCQVQRGADERLIRRTAHIVEQLRCDPAYRSGIRTIELAFAE